MKELSYLALASIIGTCAYADTVRAVTDGDWESESTWENGSTPSSASNPVVVIESNIEVNLTSGATINGFGNWGDNSILNVSMEESRLTSWINSNYNFSGNAQINITDGAQFVYANNNAQNQVFALLGGSNSASFNVTNSTLSEGLGWGASAGFLIGGENTNIKVNLVNSVWNSYDLSTSTQYNAAKSLISIQATGSGSASLSMINSQRKALDNASSVNISIENNTSASNSLLIAGNSLLETCHLTIGGNGGSGKAVLQFGAYNGNGTFHAAQGGSLEMISDWSTLKINEGAVIKILADESNLLSPQANLQENAFIRLANGNNNSDYGPQGRVLYLNGEFVFDMKEVDASSLEKGETYLISLIYANHWDDEINFDNVSFDVINNENSYFGDFKILFTENTLALSFAYVPEPKTFAAMFGALAAAFAFYRRRK